ncbi:MAG: Uracil-DNA glycosylase [Candidatus Anoxychlamydiales bacterium]|nr:Uracil-DNA glycosylase [Candidatus Anoxychlamydiales bacterium]
MDSKDFFMEKSWAKVLAGEFEKEYMKNLQKFLISEIESNQIIYPPKDLIFNAFCQTPYDKVKVVIVGQDPYHGKGQAHGLSFSVPKGINSPPSLKNIFQEQIKDVGIKMPIMGELTHWAKQGVLLLNATLTVRESSPKSHYGKGWEIFTDKVIDILSKSKKPIIFLLWGKSAKEKLFNAFIDRENTHHLILTAAHPSFYSVAGFFGCKHFSKTNEFLIKNNIKPIDWQIA